MGRLARRLPSPSSGAIIFYGRNGPAPRPSHRATSTIASSEASSSTHSSSSASSTLVKSDSDVADESDGSNFDPRTQLSLEAISRVPDGLNPPVLSTSSPDGLGKGVVAGGTTVLRLAEELVDAFSEVPYVKIVVSLVQQIITIAGDIRANKDRSEELVNKVATYGRVVFEALLAVKGQESTSEDVSDLKEDLLQIASVLGSIYDILKSTTGSKSMPLWKKILYRDDIASKLSEQDRRLDTTVTAFQLKSSIVLRSRIDKTGHTEHKSDIQRSFKYVFHSIGLRSRPQIVYGREKEIDLIVKAILQPSFENQDPNDESKHPLRICILGSGGIGKTTLALSVVHHKDICRKFEGQRFFVSCEAAPSADLLLTEIVTALGLEVEEVKVNALQTALQRLGQAESLLVLDNFETPWDPPQNRSRIEGLLAELTSLETLTLIVTMRGSQRPAGTLWTQTVPPLQPVDEDSAISIFKAIASKVDQHVVNLIRAVDCVPLAVTLLANLAAVEGESTEALWERWEEERTSMIENGQDRLNSIEASIQLSLSSSCMRRDPGALLLLSAFSLLPDGVSASTCEACIQGFPDVVSVKKAISTLRQNALVYEDSNKDLRILSPIRFYICGQYPPSSRARDFIFDYFIKLAHQGIAYHDATIRLVLQREVNNITAILTDALASSRKENMDEVIQATINFCHFTYVSGKGSSQAIEAAVEKLETLRLSSPALPPATSVNQRSASTSWYKAFRAFGKPVKPPSVRIPTGPSTGMDSRIGLQADCLGCWGQILSRQREFELARDKFVQAQDLHAQAGDIAGQAYDLLNQGLLMSRDSDALRDALEILERAYELHDRLGDRAGMAHDLLASGHAFRDLGEFANAQIKFTSAAVLFEELGDKTGHASALNGLGAILLFLSQCSEAEILFMKASEFSRNVGDTVLEAESIAGVAVACLLQSRFMEAKSQIERAMALRQPAVEPDHLYVLGRVFIALQGYEEAKAQLNQALAYHESTGDIRGQSEDLLELGSIAFLQDDYYTAAGYAVSARSNAPHNRFLLAESDTLEAQIRITEADFSESSWLLESSLAVFDEVGSKLGQAQCLYIWAIQHIHCMELDLAIEKLNKALDLHVEVGNIQGQADDLNKLCEALMHQGSTREAMSLIAEALGLHIRIGDRCGQGDDLYVQASLFLFEGRFVDAEMTMRKALELHTAVPSRYGIARDSASLSDILWQQQKKGGQSGSGDEAVGPAEDPFTYLNQALEIFKDISAATEFIVCRAQRRHMQGKEPLDIRRAELGYYYLTDEEDENIDEA